MSRPRRRFVERYPLIPVLVLSAYPAAFLWAANRNAPLYPSDVLPPLVLSMAGATAVHLLLRACSVEPVRAGVLTSFTLVLFFSFGHVARLAPGEEAVSERLALEIAYLALLVAGWIVITRASRRSFGAVLSGQMLAAGSLVALNLLSVGSVGFFIGPSLPRVQDAKVAFAREATPDRLPDVYYVIFDRYGGAETLRDLYGFDNRPFLTQLGARGFTIVEDAFANYPGTTHSLASSLNMTYLDGIAAAVGEESQDWHPLQASLRGSAVQQVFDDLGYRTVHIGSWWAPTFEDPAADRSYVFDSATEFHKVFVYSTALPYLAGAFGGLDIASLAEVQAERIPFQLSALEEVSQDPRPTFTFAHFTLPHPPYVFDAQGDRVDPDAIPSVEAAYVEQLRFTNHLILELVDSLLDDASGDPIIVLASDEGPHPPEVDREADPQFDWEKRSTTDLARKLRILEALYLPEPAPAVPPTFTPVNIFRLILSSYFGTDAPLLPDRIYLYRRHDRPYLFEDVTARVVSP